jgi:hypothetical protein
MASCQTPSLFLAMNIPESLPMSTALAPAILLKLNGLTFCNLLSGNTPGIHAALRTYIVFTMTNIGGTIITPIPNIKHATAILRCFRITMSTTPVIVSRNPIANSISAIPIALSAQNKL